MKIRYRKKIVNRNLILGVVWLIFGAVQAIFIEDSNPFNYAWFVLSGVYFVLYFNQKNKKYLTIKNGVIKQNWPLGKEMNLKEIKQIKHFAGEYILKSETKKLTINIDLIDERSLEELKIELKKLNVDWS